MWRGRIWQRATKNGRSDVMAKGSHPWLPQGFRDADWRAAHFLVTPDMGIRADWRVFIGLSVGWLSSVQKAPRNNFLWL